MSSTVPQNELQSNSAERPSKTWNFIKTAFKLAITAGIGFGLWNLIPETARASFSAQARNAVNSISGMFSQRSAVPGVTPAEPTPLANPSQTASSHLQNSNGFLNNAPNAMQNTPASHPSAQDLRNNFANNNNQPSGDVGTR